MLYVVHEAIELYNNTNAWQELMKKAILTDFSWAHSADEYKKLYAETFDVLK